MTRSIRLLAAATAAFVLMICGAIGAQVPQVPAPDSAVARAVAYLVVEVPRWRQEHPCYSCHNNGDAVRALIAASGRGHAIGQSIDDTLAWLGTPERWDSNGSRPGSNDLPLGRIQFATTLFQMVAWNRATVEPLEKAALLLVELQKADGSFVPNESQTVGGATAYGPALATALAHRVLARVTSPEAKLAASRARDWMRSASTATVLDSSSILIGLERDGDVPAREKRPQALAVLKRAQGQDGGWGPYVTSQSDVFDTALALMALVMVRNVEELFGPAFTEREIESSIARARAFLITAQNADGSWPETTRPANGESYAQRISTTAWALQALMASE